MGRNLGVQRRQLLLLLLDLHAVIFPDGLVQTLGHPDKGLVQQAEFVCPLPRQRGVEGQPLARLIHPREHHQLAQGFNNVPDQIQHEQQHK
ncbi:hypothetical protein D3C81_1739670 [compost metagenome]